MAVSESAGLSPLVGATLASLTSPSPAFVGLSFCVGGLTWDNSLPFGVGTVANAFQVQFQ